MGYSVNLFGGGSLSPRRTCWEMAPGSTASDTVNKLNSCFRRSGSRKLTLFKVMFLSKNCLLIRSAYCQGGGHSHVTWAAGVPGMG